MKLILNGHVVPLADDAPQQTFDGRVLIEDDRVVQAQQASDALPAEFQDARQVDLGDAFIYPGFIDLHSHIAYNTLPLWSHPGESRPYLNRNVWPRRSSYGPEVSWPAYMLSRGAPEALLAYVQVRALAGGTTTLQGWPSYNRRSTNQLVRSADDEKVENSTDRVRTSVMTKRTDELGPYRDALQTGSFIYHCAEGQPDSTVVNEFEDLANANSLRQRLIAIHCNALDASHFQQWRQRAQVAGDDTPGTVVWSPFSNLWLYGETTPIPDALENQLNVTIGTDWGPSGTKNLLGELKVARLVSDDRGWSLSNFELVSMVTRNPGAAMSLCWSEIGGAPLPVGRLQPLALADIAVVARREDDPWDNLIAAREEDVSLVLVGGEPRYGSRDLMRACGVTRTTSVAKGGLSRHTVLTHPEDKDKEVEDRRRWYFKNVLEALDAVVEDPRSSVDLLSAPTATSDPVAATRAGPAVDRLQIELDMPGEFGQAAGKPPDNAEVTVPAIESLRHDRRWRASLTDRGFHNGLLDGLDQFYA